MYDCNLLWRFPLYRFSFVYCLIHPNFFFCTAYQFSLSLVWLIKDYGFNRVFCAWRIHNPYVKLFKKYFWVRQNQNLFYRAMWFLPDIANTWHCFHYTNILAQKKHIRNFRQLDVRLSFEFGSYTEHKLLL